MATHDSEQPKPGSAPEVKKRRRGLWWKIPLALVIVLVLLVLLLPTIASMGFARNMVLDKINATAPGKLAISDWSLGWFSGAKVKGVEWTDAQGQKLATVGEIDTPVTLMQLATGNWHFGEIVVKDVTADVVVPLEKKAEPPKTGGGGKQQPPPNIPDIAAKVRIENVGGKITFVGENGRKESINLDRSTRVLVDMPGGGSPVKYDALVALVQPGGTGTASVAGVVNGVKPGPLDVKQLTGDAQLKLSAIDLNQGAAIMRVMGQDLALKGALSGQVNVVAAEKGRFSAKGELGADNVLASVGKDQLTTKTLRIPIDVEVTGEGEAARAIVRELSLAIDQAQVAVTADLPLKALDDLKNNRPAAQTGNARIVASVPSLPVLMNAMPNTFKLQQGVQVTGGQFACEASMNVGPNGISVAVPASVRGLAATRDGRKIGPLAPISLSAAARLPSLSPALNDISDIAVDVTSSFASLNARGNTLATANAKGNCDLVKMREEFGEIIDLSMIRGGQVVLDLTNRDAGAKNLDTDLRLQLVNFGVNLKTAEGAIPRHVEGGTLLVTAQTAYRDGKLAIKQPLQMDVAGKLFEDPPGKPSRMLLDQTAQLRATGQADLAAKRQQVSLDQLSLVVGQNLAVLSLPPGRPLNIVLAGEKGVTTDARLLMKADLAAIQELQSQLSPSTQPAGQLAKGLFSGELFCTVAGDGAVKAGLTHSKTSIDYVSAQQRYTDEISAAVSAALSADMSTAGINALVEGKLVNVALDGTAGLVQDAQGNRQLKTLRVSKLDARTAYADINLAQPIVISDMPALMGVFRGGDLPEDAQVGGELLVKSDLAKLMEATATAATPTASARQISGALTSRQTIALRQRDLVADVAADVTSLKVTQAGKTVVEEPKLTIGGRLRVNPAAKWMQFNNVAITSASGMLDLKAFVRINELGSQNRIENGKVELTPDWAKLWPVIFAMMPPEKQAKIGEMIVTGKKTNVITFDGSFPADKPYEQAVKQVRAAGDLTLEQVDWKTHGIVLSGTIPFRLAEGIARFDRGPNKPVVPLICNEGKVDVSKAEIDITGDSPRLDMPPKTKVATDLKLNKVLVSSLGKFSNPLFIDPEQTSGFLSLTVIECKRLPLSTAMYDPKNGGRAEFSMDLRQLDIASKGVNNVLGAMDIQPEKGKDRVTGDIKDGRVIIADGRCIQKMNVQLGDKTFAFDGNMDLASVSYSLLNVGVPKAVVATMLDKWFNVEEAESYLPEHVGLKFSGPASALKLDRSIVGSLAKDILAQQGTRAVLGGLLGRDKNKSTTAPSSKPSADGTVPATKPAVEDVIGDLLKGLSRPREEK